MSKKKKPDHDPAWAKAKRLCRLNQEDIRKAKALGFKPKSLIKNIPNKSQQWKAPVKVWIRDLYEERFGHDGNTRRKRDGKVESNAHPSPERDAEDQGREDTCPF